LLTHRQTDKQTKTGKNITSLAEVTRSAVKPPPTLSMFTHCVCHMAAPQNLINYKLRKIWPSLILLMNCFALSRNSEESENPVLCSDNDSDQHLNLVPFKYGKF